MLIHCTCKIPGGCKWSFHLAPIAGSDNVLSIIGFKMKVLEEKIPTSYEQLRRFVEALPSRQEPTEHPPAIKRKEFWCVVII